MVAKRRKEWEEKKAEKEKAFKEANAKLGISAGESSSDGPAPKILLASGREKPPKKRLMWIDEAGEADSVFKKIEYMQESEDDEPPPPPAPAADDDEDDGLSTPVPTRVKKQKPKKMAAPSLGLPSNVKKMETTEFAASARPDEDAGGYSSAVMSGMLF